MPIKFLLVEKRNSTHSASQEELAAFHQEKRVPTMPLVLVTVVPLSHTALGMIVARDLSGEDNKVIAVVGDGSMTAGMSFEGLNQAGHLKKDLIVILNDNEMSISRNVGGLSLFLSRKFTGRIATKLKKEFETFFQSIPKIGEGLVSIAKRAEDSLVSLLTPGMLFEGWDFTILVP